jgi:hypothetical protein
MILTVLSSCLTVCMSVKSGKWMVLISFPILAAGNDGISYSERLNSHLNNTALDSQRINLEQQLHRLLETFD